MSDEQKETNEENAILDAIKGIADTVETKLKEVDNRIKAIEEKPVNLPVPTGKAPSEKKVTKMGFSDEQNETYLWYMRTGDKQPAAKAGLLDETLYNYEYEDGRIKAVTAQRVKDMPHSEIKSMSVKQITGTTPAAGGILVPRDHLRMIIQKRDEMSVMRQAGAMVFRTNSDNVDIPVEDTKQAKFTIVAQGAATPEDTPDFTPKNASPNTWRKTIKISEEIVMDEQSNLIPWLVEGAGRAWGLTENEQYFVGAGDGSTGPQGAITGASGSYTTAALSAVTGPDVIGWFYANTDYLLPSSAFVTSPATEALIRAIQGDEFNFVPQSVANQSFPGTTAGRVRELMGQPFMTTQEIAGIGASAKIGVQGDFYLGYVIVERLGMEVRRLDQTYADNMLVGYRFVTRQTGLVGQAEALTVLDMPAT